MPEINITKIEAHAGVHWLEMDLGPSAFEDFPERIVVLGTTYFRSSWNSDHNTLMYRSR